MNKETKLRFGRKKLLLSRGSWMKDVVPVYWVSKEEKCPACNFQDETGGKEFWRISKGSCDEIGHRSLVKTGVSDLRANFPTGVDRMTCGSSKFPSTLSLVDLERLHRPGKPQNIINCYSNCEFRWTIDRIWGILDSNCVSLKQVIIGSFNLTVT